MKIIKIGIAGLKKFNFKFRSKKKFELVNLNQNYNYENIKKLEAIVFLMENGYENLIKKLISDYNSNKLNSLKWVHFARAGVDGLNFKKKIQISCTKGYQSNQLAEHSIAMLLSFIRKINRPYKINFQSLKNKKVLILGSGGSAQKISEILKKFDCRIDGTYFKVSKKKQFENLYQFKDNIYNLLCNYDIFINTLPLTKKTKGMIDKRFFNAAGNKEYIFISFSRDQTINLKDLKKNISLNRNCCFGIDFFNKNTYEVFSNYKYKNCIFSHHKAGITDDYHKKINLSKLNIINFLTGKKIINLVNINDGY